MNNLEFGIPKKQPKQKLDINPEKMMMSIIKPKEGEKVTTILFNSLASKILNLDKGSIIAFAFNKNIVANVSNMCDEPDGKIYFNVYKSSEYAGCYILNKPSADFILKTYTGVETHGCVSFELGLNSETGLSYPTLEILNTDSEKTVLYDEVVATTNEA